MATEIAARERAWQERWAAAGLAKARARPGVPKFYLIFAYPGTSGFMHVGHMRGYCYADYLTRYHRMKGEEVFFPAGIHASGLPAIIFAGKVARRDPATIESLLENGAKEEDLSALEDPVAASRFLGESYWRVWKDFGLLLDESANVSTIDADYQQFIRWQFQRLRRSGHLVQKPYFAAVCPRSGPVSIDASETDLDRGGNAEVITYTALPFTLPDGRRLLCATLRPETVYGVTNLWVAPNATLQEWKHDGRVDLLSKEGVEKVLEQWGGEKGAELPAHQLLAGIARAPLTGEEVPVLESALVDPAVGTGVVMSVPAHAPADFVAVQELPEPLRSRLLTSAKVLLELPDDRLAPSEKELFAGTGHPAERAVRSIGVRGLGDKEKLDEATERVYRAEHRHGVMTVLGHEGEPVESARRRVGELILEKEGGCEVREFSEPVICRCGTTVVIRRVPDQWFLAYGDKSWKEQVRAQLPRMRILPEDYGHELPGILDWFEDRPAVRKGRWLGTPFPEDPEWIIEPIADSTLYPAYFVVRRFVTAKRIAVEQLTPAFFDYVFRGEGDGECSLPKELQDEARRDFLYFYPLDLNMGGKEHKRVHFPPFLYNHAALLPPEQFPRGIFVNWWITGESGKKLSKKDINVGGKRGNAVPTVYGAMQLWGADGLRLYYATAVTPFQDLKWEPSTCSKASDRATEVFRTLEQLFHEFRPSHVEGPLALTTPIDRWFSSVLSGAAGGARAAFEDFDLRRAAEIIYVEVPALLKRYRARGGSEPHLLGRLADVWARLLCPITPHLAEEAAKGHREGLVSTAAFPDGTEFPRDAGALARESLLGALEDDVAALLKTWKGPAAELRIFVADPWKAVAEAAMREALAAGTPPDLGSMMKSLRGRPELHAHLGALPDLLKLYDLRSMSAGSRPAPGVSPREEELLWSEAAPYLASRFTLGKVEIVAEAEAAPLDPKGRRKRAQPGRPGLYLVEKGP
jgi:leucyl-tRNA synthetase